MNRSIVLAVFLHGFAWAACDAAAGPAATNTVITSKHASFDYKRSIAEFVGDVVVVDPEVRMQSEKLTVLFDGSNDVKSVTAVGGVRLWYQTKTATCDKAVYLAGDGEIIMTGHARIEDAKDSVAGDVIQIWIREERMTVEPGRLVIYPGEGRKKSVFSEAPRPGSAGMAGSGR